MTLTNVAPGLHTVTVPHTMFGIQFGARMTVLETEDGLVLHSPIAASDELRAAVSALGGVAAVLGPNKFHHLWLGEWTAAHPDARLLGAPGLAQKRTDLSFHGVLGEAPLPGDLDLEVIGGTEATLGETALLHRPSGTLVLTDLAIHIPSSDHWWTRTYMTLAGCYGKPGTSKVITMSIKDRARARESLDRILGWDFERIVVAHGQPILDSPKDTLRELYAWL